MITVAIRQDMQEHWVHSVHSAVHIMCIFPDCFIKGMVHSFQHFLKRTERTLGGGGQGLVYCTLFMTIKLLIPNSTLCRVLHG